MNQSDQNRGAAVIAEASFRKIGRPTAAKAIFQHSRSSFGRSIGEVIHP